MVEKNLFYEIFSLLSAKLLEVQKSSFWWRAWKASLGRRFPSHCSLPRLSLVWPCHCIVLKCLFPDLTIPLKLASGRFCCVGLRREGVNSVRNPVGTGQFYNLPLWWPELLVLHDFQMGDFNLSEHSLPVACKISSNVITSNSLSNSHLTNFKIQHVINHLLSWLSGYTLWESLLWGSAHNTWGY